MKPYYEDDMVTLYHGSCLEITEWVAADVLVTDPPYGVSFRSNQRKGEKLTAIAGDTDPEIRNRALALWGSERPAIVFGNWRVMPPAGERQRLIWAKFGNVGMGNLAMPWGTSHEDIHVLGDGWDRVATGQKRSGSVITGSGARGGAHGAENATGHPTPKPVPLMENLIQRCPPGVIAEPFAGSGATLVAARNLGRKAIGVELEERYCEGIANRLAQGSLIF